MDKNKKQQNIYNSSEKEQNIYTPQIEKDLINERDKEIKRKKNISTSFFIIFRQTECFGKIYYRLHKRI